LLGHAQGVLLDGLRLRGRHDQHRQLAALALLKSGQRQVDLFLLLPAQGLGEVHDVAAQWRHGHCCRRLRQSMQ
jgi:hypothetical protein